MSAGKRYKQFSLNRWTYSAYALVATYLLFAPEKILFQCPIHSLFGIYCPSCGATRAARAISSGNFLLALHNNAFIVLAPAGIGVWFFVRAKSDSRKIRGGFAVTAVIICLIFTILRNQIGSPLAPLDG